MIKLQTSTIKAREGGFKFLDCNLPELKQVTAEDGTRHYEVLGRWLPSVTTVLSANKQKKAILARWRSKVGEEQANKITKAATKRGSALHKLCEDYLINSEVSVECPIDRERFFKVKEPLDNNLGTIYCIESALCSLTLNIAGRCDLIAEFGGITSVIDFKTSGKDISKYKERIQEYYMQGTAYSLMFEELTGIAVPQVVIINVCEEHLKPQIFVTKSMEYVQPLKAAIAAYQETVHGQEGLN